MWYTHLLLVKAGLPGALVYLGTYEGCSIGECFRDIGYNSLVVYDKMNNHAKSYRQISLLIKNPPGREAYPGDMFYQQARLLERAAQLAKRFGYGALSAFPIYETQRNNMRTLIATNLISITDGQIYLNTKIFRRGVKPAIDVFKSVSRVGTRAQPVLLTWASQELGELVRHYFKTEQKKTLGHKLKGKKKINYFNKAKTAMSVWKQRIHDLNTFEEQVIMNLAMSCCHLCLTYPRTAILWLLKNFNLRENKWFSEELLWFKNADWWEIPFDQILMSYYIIQKAIPRLFKECNSKGNDKRLSNQFKETDTNKQLYEKIEKLPNTP